MMADIGFLNIEKGAFIIGSLQWMGIFITSYLASILFTRSDGSRSGYAEDGSMIHNYSKITKLRILWSARKRARMHFPTQDLSKVRPMKHQVGGHKMLTSGSKYLLKPIIVDSTERGFREVAFYEAVKEAVESKNGGLTSSLASPFNAHTRGADEISSLLVALSPFIPEYFGVIGEASNFRFGEGFAMNSHIILSDVTSAYKNPCVLDLKMGRQTFEPDAPIKKRESQLKKYPEQDVFGFRIVGMNVYDPSNTESNHLGYRRFDKKFGRGLKRRQQIHGALATFFNSKNNEDRTKMVRGITQEIKTLRMLFEEYNRNIALYASSILIVFEGNNLRLSPEQFTVKIIDFAHVRYQSGGDSGYIHGIETFIEMLEDVVGE